MKLNVSPTFSFFWISNIYAYRPINEDSLKISVVNTFTMYVLVVENTAAQYFIVVNDKLNMLT